ncbi:TIGR03620 family F420-dependent LLM class oxidoreductase [Sinosporangium siamense]|uniref:LLM class F420-dependent oxidoreductase n=1 Tax=Sinosporangium siamense TaxID=1367973 RepID=A0A919RI35_9ACTN|nr:TIGR03620 family F420-dependent LLM class oxidoreductase [Sinosporangium siamense]GII92244.1 LLM class F420-dependent oxidoreductase [Sinosporangium siamense]
MTTSTVVEEARRRLGPIGVWLPISALLAAPAEVERDAVRRLEAAGYGSFWTGEVLGGKEAFAHHAVLLAAGRSMVVGTGVANLWARHHAAMQGGGATLAEAYPGRFVLGVGVSHRPLVENSGLTFDGSPLQRVRDYLDGMDAAAAGPPDARFPRVLAALGPKMLELARDRADGAHPFLATVEHTARARRILGPGKLLIPHQPVLLLPDPAQARAVARTDLAEAVAVESVYGRHFRRLGYGDDDLAGGLSDRFVDDVVAWGDETAIAKRVRGHLDAGADHVLLHPLLPGRPLRAAGAGDVAAAVGVLENLAPAVLGA